MSTFVNSTRVVRYEKNPLAQGKGFLLILPGRFTPLRRLRQDRVAPTLRRRRSTEWRVGA